MNSEMMQYLLSMLKNSTNNGKDEGQINVLYSQLENMLSSFQQFQQPMQPPQEMYRDNSLSAYADIIKSIAGLNINEKKDSCCHFETKELIKNGGFEVINPDPLQVFSNWLQTTNKTTIAVSKFPYEGESAAKFVSQESSKPEYKTAQLFQNINVKPCCLYELSFAEDYFACSQKAACKAKLTARVFFGDPTNKANQTDLINVDIYKPNSLKTAGRGYSLHRITAEVAIPNNVSSATVEFKFEVTDIGKTVWRIDSVSVRPVSAATVNRC